MSQLPYPAFDADNHYYEAHDCFTRHIEPAHRDRAIRYVEEDGRPSVRVGDEVVGKLHAYIEVSLSSSISKNCLALNVCLLVDV